MITRVKSTAEIEAMREGGQMLAGVLAVVKKEVVPGVTTKALADKAANELQALGGKPAFLGYQGYPDVLCVSVNEEVVHGIPRASRVIKEGDIVSLDFGVLYKNLITDGAITVIAGKALSPKHTELVETTLRSLEAGIRVIHDHVKVGDISNAVEVVLKSKHYGIVRDLVGHGVGDQLHEEPNVPNYGFRGTGPLLMAGMTIAIEPMATLGGDRVFIADDDWTVVTVDGSWAAHFEHSVVITEAGAEILTAAPSDNLAVH